MSWWLSSTRSVPPRAVGDERLGERAGPGPELLQHAQRLAGGPPQFGVVALRLELDQHHDRDDDVVLVEAHEGTRVGEQDRRVEDVGA